MSWSSPRLRDEWGGRLLKARAVVVLPESAALPMPGRAQAESAVVTVDGELAAALAEASAIRAKAETEGRQEGLRLGAREGYAEGYAEGQAEGLRRAAEEGGRLIEEARTEADALRREALAGVGRLACEIASHLIGSAVALDDDLVRDHVARILSECQPLGVLEVLVHPQDMKAARAAKAYWLAEMAGEVEVGVVPDPGLTPGSCRVRSRAGDIEWIWPERLGEIDRAMQEVAERLGLDA